MLDFFNAEIGSDISVDIDEELLTLTNDFKVKPQVQKVLSGFLSDNYSAKKNKNNKQTKKYPSLRERIKVLSIVFPSPYIVERG